MFQLSRFEIQNIKLPALGILLREYSCTTLSLPCPSSVLTTGLVLGHRGALQYLHR